MQNPAPATLRAVHTGGHFGEAQHLQNQHASECTSMSGRQGQFGNLQSASELLLSSHLALEFPCGLIALR